MALDPDPPQYKNGTNNRTPGSLARNATGN
jgi:hypothetical protein